jgi:GxxExxY protein
MDKVKLDAITEKIIGTAHKVSNTLGIGFVEKVYENAHAHEMRKDGLTVVQQHPIKVVYDDIVVGDFFCRSVGFIPHQNGKRVDQANI